MTSTKYSGFLASKLQRAVPTGLSEVPELSAKLFPFQRDLVTWALRRGRAALFADTGTGKSLMQLDWARVVHEHTRKPVLILTPLAVAAQTVREGAKFGIDVKLCRSGEDVGPGINITNYDRLHLFDPSRFGAVVLDESSILKDFSSSTRNALISAFRDTPFKLACTATPAPNDFEELGNHAEFLGVMSRVEMLSMYFVHDGGSTQDWRLKGHAEQEFWSWVCSWGLVIKRPSDLGYEDGGFALPPLVMHEHIVAGSLEQARAAGMLFVQEVATLPEQRAARRASLDSRVRLAASLVAAEPNEPWLIWCELNAEGDALEKTIPGAVQVSGSDTPEVKENAAIWFAEPVDGKPRILVSKASIFGAGLNFQSCARMTFVGIGHSFEQFYQAVRRSWRFGQTRAVECHVITSEAEGSVLANLKRKQADAERMGNEMSKHTASLVRAAVGATARDGVAYTPRVRMRVPSWLTEEA